MIDHVPHVAMSEDGRMYVCHVSCRIGVWRPSFEEALRKSNESQKSELRLRVSTRQLASSPRSA